MKGEFKIRINQIEAFLIILMGVSLVISSAIYASSFFTILGASFVFWGAILLYITPSKHVPLALLNATTDLSNIERILIEFGFSEKGVYLPPANLENIDSTSSIFLRKEERPCLNPEK